MRKLIDVSDNIVNEEIKTGLKPNKPPNRWLFYTKGIMKQLDLPFKIDKQFENWEFELEALDDRVIGYQSYRYIGKEFKYFLNFTTHKTELIFNADYLTAVIITINNSDRNELSMINSLLGQNASKEVVLNEYTRRYKIYSIKYYIVFNLQKNQALIIYGKPRFIQRHLLLLQNI